MKKLNYHYKIYKFLFWFFFLGYTAFLFYIGFISGKSKTYKAENEIWKNIIECTMEIDRQEIKRMVDSGDYTKALEE
jgi:hypothetical protein